MLGAAPRPETFPLGDVPLAQKAAGLLAEWGAAPRAVAMHQAILANPDLGRDWRATILRDAVAAARAAGDTKQADAWNAELTESLATPLIEGKP